MGAFGGKADGNPWLIETTDIDTGDPTGPLPDRCPCLREKRELGVQSVCACPGAGDKWRFPGGPVPHSHTPDVGQASLERRKKTQDSKPAAAPEGCSLSGRGAHSNKKYQLYKTEMCRSHTEIGYCKYGDKCQFAHSEAELRYVQRHPKYKTETCKTFWEEGSCPYGKRCCFIHIPNTGLGRMQVGKRGKEPEGDSQGASAIPRIEIDEQAHDKLIYTEIDQYMSLRRCHLSGPLDKEERNALREAPRTRCQPDEASPLDTTHRPFYAKDLGLPFEPIVEDDSDGGVMMKRPFWESSYSSIWMDDEEPLFHLGGPTPRRAKGGVFAPGGAVRKTFNKKISDFVFGHLNM